MPGVKKQHYVPQFYLKKFADRNGKLYAFNKLTKKSFQTTVRDAASGMRFYDIHPEIHNQFRERVADTSENHPDAALIAKALDPQLVEHELGEREARYALILDEVLHAIRSGRHLTDKQRWYMSEFIALQIVRTPQARKMNIDLQKALFEELLKRSSDSPTDAYYVEFNESFASIEHAQLMFDPQLQLGLGHAIANHIWLFGKNISSQQFYISDTPVVRRSHLQPPLMGAGFGSYGLEVAFPLTPEFVLIMCDRRAFFPLARLDESIIDLKSDHITYYNAMQVLESYRSLYCSLGEFLLAADISNAFPGTSDPEHIRVQ